MDERKDPVVSEVPASASVAKPSITAAGDSVSIAGDSVLANVLPHILETLKREPALGITLAYLLVAMAGIFYNYSFYQKFDIEILTLSQVNDLLVAGIQQPMALALVLSTFPLCWLFDQINLRGRKRRARKLAKLQQTPQTSLLRRVQMRWLAWTGLHARYMSVFYIMVIALYGWTFVSIYAEHRASLAKRGEAPQVNVWLTGDTAPLPAQSRTWTYLGAVSNYVFLYDHVSRHTEILPINNVTRIEPVAPVKPANSGVMVVPIP